ncbi:Lrp/AsnC family transcriptional regulator [Vogesella sp. LIG4]|uniref:Lrp/AsnC family transcriptional regulator n=1 Tax=Vogesella sp. LIG4 TaxID=1192162 RepID=UPI00081FA962|nr:Lrp/AsnC family transcriptional regulator [Vogesella sp. LIG4]SCK19005.1 DNA-binding transcriptional regulator, Lrp family [Vogesella sp. LIG4]
MQLDRIDLQIISILRHDARITYQALSEMVHLTARPCQERVRKLERAGVIRGYHAEVVLPQAESVVVMAQLALGDKLGRGTQLAFEQTMRDTPEVEDCWLISGEFDYQLRVRCRDLAHFRELSGSWLDDTRFRINRIVSNPQLQQIKLGRR